VRRSLRNSGKSGLGSAERGIELGVLLSETENKYCNSDGRTGPQKHTQRAQREERLRMRRERDSARRASQRNREQLLQQRRENRAAETYTTGTLYHCSCTQSYGSPHNACISTSCLCFDLRVFSVLNCFLVGSVMSTGDCSQ
jgi:hypothetical protein